MHGYADPFLAAGKNTLRVAGLAERRPCGAGADGVWKKALKRVMVRDHVKDLQGVKAHASEVRLPNVGYPRGQGGASLRKSADDLGLKDGGASEG